MLKIILGTIASFAIAWLTWVVIATNNDTEKLPPMPKLPPSIIEKIQQDIRYTKSDLSEYKEDFSEYYETDISPRIDNLKDHIKPRSFVKLSDKHYALWSEGISPTAWGAKEYLYVLSTATGKWEVLTSIQLDPAPSRTAGGYHTSSFWVNPNKGCGYNDFVVGVLQYLKVGGSGSTAYQVIIKYNRYEEQYEITTQSSPIFYSKPACAAH